MNIGIIAATDFEYEELIHSLKESNIDTVSLVDSCYTTAHLSIINDNAVYTICSGAGKVNAAIATAWLVQQCKCKTVICVGVCSTTCYLSGDILIPSSVIEGDCDTTAIGEPMWLMQKLNCVVLPTSKPLVEQFEDAAMRLNYTFRAGLMYTSDEFVTTPMNNKMFLHRCNAADLQEFPTSIDMEAAAVGHAAQVLGAQFAIIKSVSDRGDSKDYAQLKESAAALAVYILIEALRRF